MLCIYIYIYIYIFLNYDITSIYYSGLVLLIIVLASIFLKVNSYSNVLLFY